MWDCNLFQARPLVTVRMRQCFMLFQRLHAFGTLDEAGWCWIWGGEAGRDPNSIQRPCSDFWDLHAYKMIHESSTFNKHRQESTQWFIAPCSFQTFSPTLFPSDFRMEHSMTNTIPREQAHMALFWTLETVVWGYASSFLLDAPNEQDQQDDASSAITATKVAAFSDWVWLSLSEWPVCRMLTGSCDHKLWDHSSPAIGLFFVLWHLAQHWPSMWFGFLDSTAVASATFCCDVRLGWEHEPLACWPCLLRPPRGCAPFIFVALFPGWRCDPWSAFVT